MNDDSLIWQTRDQMEVPTNPLQALRESYARSPEDLGEKKFDAWVYGIIVGWDDKSYLELSVKHNWSVQQVKYNKLLHQNFCIAWNLFMNQAEFDEYLHSAAENAIQVAELQEEIEFLMDWIEEDLKPEKAKSYLADTKKLLANIEANTCREANLEKAMEFIKNDADPCIDTPGPVTYYYEDVVKACRIASGLKSHEPSPDKPQDSGPGS